MCISVFMWRGFRYKLSITSHHVTRPHLDSPFQYYVRKLRVPLYTRHWTKKLFSSILKNHLVFKNALQNTNLRNKIRIWFNPSPASFLVQRLKLTNMFRSRPGVANFPLYDRSYPMGQSYYHKQ